MPSMKHQILNVFRASGILQIGASRYKLERSIRLKYGSISSHELAQHMPILCYSTAKIYLNVWQQLGQFSKDEFKIKKPTNLTAEHVVAFLKYKINSGVGKSSIKTDASSIECLCKALNMYSDKFELGMTFNWHEQIHDCIKDKLKNTKQKLYTRAYKDPIALIECLSPESQVVAKIQLEAGCSISEILYLKIENIHKHDIIVQGHGGHKRQIELRVELIEQIKFVIIHKKMPTPDRYRAELKKACLETAQEYTGSHGFRHSYVQNSFCNYIKNGSSYSQALYKVTEAIGNDRLDSTLTYLR